MLWSSGRPSIPRRWPPGALDGLRTGSSSAVRSGPRAIAGFAAGSREGEHDPPHPPLLATLAACGGGTSSTPGAGTSLQDGGGPDAGRPDAGPGLDGGTGCVPNGTRVAHTAAITASETWEGDGVTHSVPSDLSINGTAVVTVQACAFVEMGAGASITVNDSASLVAAGTSATRYVAFYRASAGQPWGILRGAKATSRIDLSFAVLQGGGAYGGEFDAPTIAMAGTAYGQPLVPNLRVKSVVIDGPKNVGVYLDTGAAFTADSSGLAVLGAPGYPVETTMMAAGSLPEGTTRMRATRGPSSTSSGPLRYSTT